MPTQTRFKKHRGSTEESLIIFLVGDPSCEIDSHITGAVTEMWQTGERTSVYDAQREAHYLSGLMIKWVDTAGPSEIKLFVEATHDDLEETLNGLNRLPDNGCDLSMVQPLFRCMLSKPTALDKEMGHLKLARFIIRG